MLRATCTKRGSWMSPPRTRARSNKLQPARLCPHPRSLSTFCHSAAGLASFPLRHTPASNCRSVAFRSSRITLSALSLQSGRCPALSLLPPPSCRLLSSSAPRGSGSSDNGGSGKSSARLWTGLLGASYEVLPVPVPLVPSSLRLSSRLLRGCGELLLFGGCLIVAVLAVPSVLFFVESDVVLSQCVLMSVVLLYTSAALIVFRRYPLPPPNNNSTRARLSLPAGVAVGLLLCLALTVVLPVLGSSTREDPLILQLCFSSAVQPLLLLDLAVLGPLREELLFRGLLFGRLCRLLSPLPAYAASSGVFGALHSSPDSVKVLECVASGLVLAVSYRLTLTLWAPIAIHVINNTLVALLTTGLSPLCDPSTVERSMRWACSIEDAMDSVVYSSRAAVGAAEDSAGWHWRTGKQEARVACNNLFTALDRGGKGYLDADEVGFFFSLDETVLDMLSAAFTVLHDRSSIADPALPQLPSAWSSSPSLSLPSRSFFQSLSGAQDAAISALYMTLTSPPLTPVDLTSSASLVPAPSVLLTRLSRSLKSSSAASSPVAARAAFHRLHARMCAYYALFVRVMCQQRLGVYASRLSREQFMEQCERGLVVRPARMKRMVQQATLIAMGAQKHPLAFVATDSQRHAGKR